MNEYICIRIDMPELQVNTTKHLYGISSEKIEAIIPSEYETNLIGYLIDFKEQLKVYIERIIIENYLFHANISFENTYEIMNKDLNIIDFRIVTKNYVCNISDIDVCLKNLIGDCIQQIRHLNKKEWLIRKIKFLCINLFRYTYDYVCNLPTNILGINYLYNYPQSNIQDCVLNSLGAYNAFKKSPRKNPYQLTKEINSLGTRFWKKYNVVSLNNNITWDSLTKLETLNQMSIYLYLLKSIGNDKYEIRLYRKGCENINYDFVPLLLIGFNHVCLIRNLEKFICQFQNVKQKRNNILYICRECLNLFISPLDYVNHSNCNNYNTVISSKKKI